MYVFTYDCFNRSENPGRYDPSMNSVTVKVKADSEDEALVKVSALVKRDVYELNEIAEASVNQD